MDDFDGGWNDEPRCFWSVQPGNVSDDRRKAIGFPAVTINYGGTRGRMEQLLPLDQVEDKPGNFRTGEIGF